MAKDTVAMTIDVPGLKPLLRQLSRMPKDVQNGVRDAARTIADTEADRIVDAAHAEGAQASLAAQSVRSRRDRVPVIVAGGSKRLSVGGRRKRPRAGDVFFGAEFGGQRRKTTQQFEPHRGTEGYWFWPTLREDSDDMMAEYLQVIDDMARDWQFSAGAV